MLRTICFAVMVLLAPAAMAAGEDVLGPLAPYVRIDPAGKPWRTTLAQDALVLENTTEPAAVTYFYLNPERRPLAVRVRVAVDASAAGAGPSAAGLLYALQGAGSDRTYFAFVRKGEASVAVFKREGGGFRSMLETRVDGAKPGEPLDLALVETPEGVALEVNGGRIAALRSPGTGQGAVGILALGAGRFAFRDFRLGAGEGAR